MPSVESILGLSKRGDSHSVPVDKASVLALAFFLTVAAMIFCIQLIRGPLVFTKDVVCRSCRTRRRMKRIAVFVGVFIPSMSLTPVQNQSTTRIAKKA